MAYNGSGVFSLYTPGNPVVNGTNITDTWWNNTGNDIATALSTAICKDGQTTTTVRIPFAVGISIAANQSILGTTGSTVSGFQSVTAATLIPNFTTTATAGGTTTLTAISSQVQEFTGTLAQTVVFPVTSTMVLGQSFTIINNSTGVLTGNSSGGNLIGYLSPGATTIITCKGIALTTAADWSVAAFNSGQMLGNAGTKAIFYNAQTIAENITIGATQNAQSTGPITISSSFAVTIASGGVWRIL